MRLIALLLIVAASSNVGALAHPGHFHRQAGQIPIAAERVWVATTGAFRERGLFVMARDGKVQIRRADESLVTLPLELLPRDDQLWVQRRMAEIRLIAEIGGRLNAGRLEFGVAEDSHNDEPVEKLFPIEFLLAQRDPIQKGDVVSTGRAAEMAKAFEAFVKLKAIKTRWDDRYFYVESNGIPDHRMMVGITAWQQQVPLPQKYVGDNAWQIPLNPVPAKNPATTNDRFLRGAIAVAANGIPIFNPLNNRGDDAFLFGELDEFGGHCGRADDYHYHTAPVHLEKIVGQGLPIAYALDGYPIYGYQEPDGSKVKNLDSLNGHKDANGNYHYHATKTYPYLNGGFYGEVTERDGQVDPQPRAEPLRPDLRPLRDAKITDFKETKPGSYLLTYDVRGKKGTVSYTLNGDNSAKFTYVDTDGKSTSETYAPRRRGPGGSGGDDRRPPPRPADKRPSRGDQPVGDSTELALATRSNLPQLAVTSSAFKPGGDYPAEYTCDGARNSPPIEWSGAPQETKSFALNLWHVAPGNDIKSYWVIYNIPASVAKLPKNSRELGQIGVNDKNRPEYDPMCSKGPGVKKYHITVYALSSDLKLSPARANRAALLAAIKDVTLAEGTLTFQYERK